MVYPFARHYSSIEHTNGCANDPVDVEASIGIHPTRVEFQEASLSREGAEHDEALTELLQQSRGDGVPVEVWELVYGELRVIARRQLFRHARQGHLSTTGLVHEAYLSLSSDSRIADHGRAYFFGAAARAMRQIIVDHARRRARLKRGGDAPAITLATIGGKDEAFDADVLDLNRVLQAFEELSPRPARVVECRFFAGLTVQETATALSISPRTVKSDWALARAWLHRALAADDEVDSAADGDRPGKTV